MIKKLFCCVHIIINLLKLLAPITPFITERIYLNIKDAFNLKQESIHLFEWPESDKKKIDSKLEKDMDIISNIIQAALSAREKSQLGLRWPVKELIIISKDKNIVSAVEKLEDIIKIQTNIKEIRIQESFPEVKETVKADYAKIGPEFGALSPKIIANLATQSSQTILSHIEKQGKYEILIEGKKYSITSAHLIIKRQIPYPYIEAEFRRGLVYLNKERTEELEAEGYARELMRKVQALRKKAGLEKSDRIILHIKVNEDMKDMLNNYRDNIKEKVGADKLVISELKAGKKHGYEVKEKIKDYSFDICFDKKR